MTISEARQVRTEPLCDIPAPESTPSGAIGMRVDAAVEAARSWLLARQEVEGYWCGRLQGDATLESYVILLETFLGRRASARSLELAATLRNAVLPTGGWSQYPGGPAEISVSCLSYFALKLAGESPDAPHMLRSRDIIRELGGVESANTYTQYHFAFFGQYPWSDVPAIPPEMTFLPQRGPFSIYDMSSWSRTIFIPLAILYAHKPVCEIPQECGVSELRTHKRSSVWATARTRLQASADAAWLRLRSRASTPAQLSRVAAAQQDAALSGVAKEAWRVFFLGVDQLLKRYETLPGAQRVRRSALRRAERWMAERFASSDGLSAILPAMANSVMALHCLGYPEDHPLYREQVAHLEALLTRDEAGVLRMQPCVSPVWDTVLSCRALIQSGVAAEDPQLRRAATWLLSRQTRLPGDWAGRNRAEPGGWYFEFRNEFYPDVDDTSVALMVLAHARAHTPEATQHEAMQRGLRWMLGMQNADGGWAAFDRNNDKYFLTQVPFADHNAMIDPSTADITGRALECLSHFPGYGPQHPVVRRAIAFLFRDQCEDGSWYGRWGVNYIYGTWQVLRGLRAIGANMKSPQVQRAVNFLTRHQNADGGWGESIASYDDITQKARGASTPSQTAWALMGLIAAHETSGRAVQRGIRYLLDSQKAGTWEQPEWTGTGFPRVFYLDYPLYRHYFPLMALAQYSAAINRS